MCKTYTMKKTAPRKTEKDLNIWFLIMCCIVFLALYCYYLPVLLLVNTYYANQILLTCLF